LARPLRPRGGHKKVGHARSSTHGMVRPPIKPCGRTI
jgi:hypothetical protein